MVDYKKMYFKLFNAITDAIEEIKEIQEKGEDNCCKAIEILILAQQKTEEMYIEADGE